ncbi:protein FAM184A-like isoform X2 [Ciona intestinalis]
MASGGMSWQYYNNQQKYQHGASFGTSGDAPANTDMKDMHLKMSKKIAQLTKVIYALNTKNDEHEAAMNALKDAHEEETQQILAETAAKIQQFRIKIGNDLDLRKKIQNLEECVATFELEKRKAMMDVESYKDDMARQTIKQEKSHQDTVQALSRELMEAKNAFEQRVVDFESNMSNMDRERNKNMDSVSMEYRKEIGNLQQRLKDQTSSFAAEKEVIASTHAQSLAQYQQEVMSVRQEMKKIMEENDDKMEKCKNFYERELEVLRASTTNENKLQAEWLSRENALKLKASQLEASMQQKIKELSNELSVQRVEVETLREQLSQSTSQANSTSDHIKDLRDQLSKLQSDYNASCDRVHYLEEELNTANERIETQSSDLLRKSSIIGTLEAIKLTQDESIRDLESQMKDMRRRCQDLELEKTSLQKSQSDESLQLVQQIKAMSKRLETLSDEKTALTQQLKNDINEMKINHEEAVESLKQQLEQEATSMEKNHQCQVDMMKVEAQEAMDKLLVEMQERILKETEKFEQDKQLALDKVEAEKEVIRCNLIDSQNELSRLTASMNEHVNGLGDATTQISNLRSRLSELEQQLVTGENHNLEIQQNIASLKSELVSQADSYNEKVTSLLREHEGEKEKLVREQEEKWEEKMRIKLASLESNLTHQFNSEKQSALSELDSLKHNELEAAKSGWENQIRQLSTQMMELRQSFDNERREFERKLAESQSGMTDIERRLRNEAQEAATEYSNKIAHLLETHKVALEAADLRKEEELRNLENQLNSKFREESHSRLRAQQISIEAVKEKMKQEANEEMTRREGEFERDIDDVRSELMHQHASVLDDTTRQYENQLASVKADIDAMQRTSVRNEEVYNKSLNELETDLKLTRSEMSNLRNKVSEQNEMLSTLNKEIDAKGHEVLRIRSEANIELRRKEEEMMRRFQHEQDNYQADTIRNKQIMVNDFNRATETLKDRIAYLNISLRESEEKYERRESRPEDVDSINQLKDMVRERESQLQKLLDDKKFYQMELINRETNFNKVFSTAPNVGVLNPRTKKNKSNKVNTAPQRFTSQFVSVPNMNSIEPAMTGSNRLEPLRSGSSSPGSFTSNKHLQPTPPPHPKKFMR